MMNYKVNELISCIMDLSDHAVSRLLDMALDMLDIETDKVDRCPYCGKDHFVRYGHKCGKQRFLCKDCKRTFVTTTHTIMSMSHYPASVWKEVIADTISGNAIYRTSRRLGLSNECVFNMRHKFLLALQDMATSKPIILSEVSELDETYVLESLKGKELPPDIDRPPRRHGAKARKRGISADYICINTGVQRGGAALARAVNRARPGISALQKIYRDRIEDGTLLICDGLRGYSGLRDLGDYTIMDINDADKKEGSFYNLNTVNSFHRFIKERYAFYRGVATKYLNRYNTLFSLAWRQGSSKVAGLCAKLLHPGLYDFHHTIRDVKGLDLLYI